VGRGMIHSRKKCKGTN